MARIRIMEGMGVMTKQDYVKQVVKNLNCPQDKKADIEKQLLSDIDIALGEGRQLEEVLAGMGGPGVLAKEFNDNFGTGAGKQGKKGRIFVIVLAVAMAVALLAVLAYWALPKARNMDDSQVFAAYEVDRRSRAVVDAFSQGDYATLEGYYSGDMREAVTKEMLEEAKLTVGDDWGEYHGVGTVYMNEVIQRGKAYAIVQLSASYENIGVTFTLTFNSEMELVGFYMK